MHTQPSLSEHWRKLSPSDGHYGFGYYDRVPWNHDASLHLALKMPQSERLPVRGEKSIVGVIEQSTGTFHALSETGAWNHQQGAMTQWLHGDNEQFIFNDWDHDAQRLVTRRMDVRGKMLQTYDRPIYIVSPDSRWGASLNFSRIPRRGYSYAQAGIISEPPMLDDDGIFLTDLSTGHSKLIISYRQMFERHPALFLTEDRHTWLNHIMFNPDSTKLLFLMRHTANIEEPYPWQTHLYTANIDGSALCCPMPDCYWKWVSHHIWGRTPGEILIDANWQGKGNEYVVFDERVRPIQGMRISRGMGPCGHLIFSPDGQHMLADTYAIEGWQSLALVNCQSGEHEIIGRFAHPTRDVLIEDARCDLHPKWSHDSRLISVDSIHDGMRGIYVRQCPSSAGA